MPRVSSFSAVPKKSTFQGVDEWANTKVPRIDKSQLPDPVTLVLGTESVSLSIYVYGSPPPSVQWVVDRKRVKDSSRFRTTVDGNRYTLTIAKVTEELNQAVFVVATNDAGEDTCAINVTVIEDIFHPYGNKVEPGSTANSAASNVIPPYTLGESNRRRSSQRQKGSRSAKDAAPESNVDSENGAENLSPETMNQSYDSAGGTRRRRLVKVSSSRRPRLPEAQEKKPPSTTKIPDLNVSTISPNDFATQSNPPPVGTFLSSSPRKPATETANGGRISAHPSPLTTSETRPTAAADVVISKPPIRGSRRRTNSSLSRPDDKLTNGPKVSVDTPSDDRQADKFPVAEVQQTVANLQQTGAQRNKSQRSRRHIEKDTDTDQSVDDTANDSSFGADFKESEKQKKYKRRRDKAPITNHQVEDNNPSGKDKKGVEIVLIEHVPIASTVDALDAAVPLPKSTRQRKGPVGANEQGNASDMSEANHPSSDEDKVFPDQTRLPADYDSLWKLFGYKLDILCGHLLSSDVCCEHAKQLAENLPTPPVELRRRPASESRPRPASAVEELCLIAFGKPEDEQSTLAGRLKAAAPSKLRGGSPPPLPSKSPPCEVCTPDPEENDDSDEDHGQESDTDDGDVVDGRKYRCSEPPNLMVKVDGAVHMLPDVESSLVKVEKNEIRMETSGAFLEELPKFTIVKLDLVDPVSPKPTPAEPVEENKIPDLSPPTPPVLTTQINLFDFLLNQQPNPSIDQNHETTEPREPSEDTQKSFQSAEPVEETKDNDRSPPTPPVLTTQINLFDFLLNQQPNHSIDQNEETTEPSEPSEDTQKSFPFDDSIPMIDEANDVDQRSRSIYIIDGNNNKDSDAMTDERPKQPAAQESLTPANSHLYVVVNINNYHEAVPEERGSRRSRERVRRTITPARSEELLFVKSQSSPSDNSGAGNNVDDSGTYAPKEGWRWMRGARSVGNLNSRPTSATRSESSMSSRSLNKEWHVVKITTKEEIIVVSKPDLYQDNLKKMKEEFERKKLERKEKDQNMLLEKSKQEKERIEKLQNDLRKKREKQKQDQIEKQKAEKIRRQEQDKLFAEIWEKKIRERKENEEKAKKEREMKKAQIAKDKEIKEKEDREKIARELAQIEEQKRELMKQQQLEAIERDRQKREFKERETKELREREAEQMRQQLIKERIEREEKLKAKQLEKEKNEIERKKKAEQEEKNKRVAEDERERKLRLEKERQLKEEEKQRDKEKREELDRSIREMKQRLEKEKQELLEREAKALRDRIEREKQDKKEEELPQFPDVVDGSINPEANPEVVLPQEAPEVLEEASTASDTEPQNTPDVPVEVLKSVTPTILTPDTSEQFVTENIAEEDRRPEVEDQCLEPPAELTEHDSNVVVYEYSEMLSFWNEYPPGFQQKPNKPTTRTKANLTSVQPEVTVREWHTTESWGVDREPDQNHQGTLRSVGNNDIGTSGRQRRPQAPPSIQPSVQLQPRPDETSSLEKTTLNELAGWIGTAIVFLVLLALVSFLPNLFNADDELE